MTILYFYTIEMTEKMENLEASEVETLDQELTKLKNSINLTRDAESLEEDSVYKTINLIASAVTKLENDSDFNELMKEVPNSWEVVKYTKKLNDFAGWKGIKEMSVDELKSFVKPAAICLQTLLEAAVRTDNFKEWTSKGDILDAIHIDLVNKWYNGLNPDKLEELENEAFNVLQEYKEKYSI